MMHEASALLEFGGRVALLMLLQIRLFPCPHITIHVCMLFEFGVLSEVRLILYVSMCCSNAV